MGMIEKKMPEEQAVNLVRNALLVAGMEMGSQGDHWPVIKSTVHSIAKDWEDLKTERNVFAEVKTYYESMLKELDTLRRGSPEAFKIDLDVAIAELQSLYTACFAPAETVYLSDEDVPNYIQRAEVIMNTLEDEDGNA